jgi:hypothetical protein
LCWAHLHFLGKRKLTTETREKREVAQRVGFLFCESKKERTLPRNAAKYSGLDGETFDSGLENWNIEI